MQELKLLIINAQSGDAEAYGQIVRQFQDMAVAYGYSVTGDFHLAKDAAQEAFVEAFACLHNLKEPLAFSGWLRRIVFKHCDRFTRNKHVSVVSLHAALEESGLDCEPHKAMEKHETALQVRNAIATLPRHERDVTLLFYMGEHSQNQIAEFLEVPVTTVKKRLHTARKKLKEKMIHMIQENLEGQRPSRNSQQDRLMMRVVEPDSAAWDVAVENKRRRAFDMVEKDGISRQEIEQRYDAYRQEKGISYHNERLRGEVGDGQLLTWWQGKRMVAYAPVSSAQLLGNADHGVFNVSDIWAQPSLSPLHFEQIVSDLLEQARGDGAPHVQICCDDVLAAANLRLGGAAVKHWFQFNLADAQKVT